MILILKKKQHTPLSNTEYFNEAVAEYINYQHGELKSLEVKEFPKESSPYILSALDVTHLYPRSPFGGHSPALRQKRIRLVSAFVYHDIKLEIHYGYLLSSKGEFEPFENFAKEEGLYISFLGIVDEREWTKIEDLARYGISEMELKEMIKKDLNHLLSYWVDNYAGSKFKHDDFGEYDIVGRNRDLFL